MTPTFACGFECGQLGANGEHFVSGAGISIVTSPVRTGSRALRVQASASAPRTTTASGVFGSQNIWVWRFYIQFASLPTADCDLSTISTINAGVYFKQSDGKIYPGYNDGSVITFGSTGFLVSVDRWYLIDLKVNSSNNPWTIDASINGNAMTQLTKATAATTGTLARFGTAMAAVPTYDLYIDDIVVSQTAADYPIGNGQVRHFVPTSDGTHNIAGTGDFQRTLTGTDILNATTTAYQLIDDVPLESGASVDWINLLAPPNATDYVECIFGPAPGVPTPTYGPRAVEVIAGIHHSGTGSGNMEIRLNDNGTNSTIYTATGVAGTTSVIYKRAHFATAPTGGAWGVASGNGNFNNVRMRFGSPAAVDANPDQYLDCIMIEAEFAEWPQKITNVKQAVNRSNTY